MTCRGPLRGQPVADIVQCGLVYGKLLTEQHLHDAKLGVFAST